VSATILVVDDEPDVEALLRQPLRREIRDGRFNMAAALSTVPGCKRRPGMSSQ
jgi:DNA-binding NtrC family response regulator